MKFTEITAVFEAAEISLAEELICDIFFDFGLKGVVCDVPIEEPDEGFGTHTLPELDRYSVRGYLPATPKSAGALDQLKNRLEDLAALNIQISIHTGTVDEQDWENAWKEYFEVTRITDRIVIRPEWRSYQALETDCVIRLDPGMAFGTGTHPTTAMCLKLLEKYIRQGDRVLDVGAGSGILMIAAGMLGAAHLTGVDTDEVAVAVSQKNLTKNQIPASMSSLVHGTLDQISSGPFDLIAANIIAQVIVEILPQIAGKMHDRSTALLSGIIKEHENSVAAAAEACGLEITEIEYTEEWVAMAVRRQSGGQT